MNFINIFDVNNDQSYPPKVLKNEHFSGLIIIKIIAPILEIILPKVLNQF